MSEPTVWVFGYGSLVSPASFGATIGRTVGHGPEFVGADLVGFGRRWNHGIGGSTGVDVGPDGGERVWTLVALGLVAAPDQTVNGIVARVTARELAALDRRERSYDRVEVAASIRRAPIPDGESVVTYVPRQEAIDRALQARADGRAAIEQRYASLVERAFRDLGDDQLQQYRTSTPDEGDPILDVVRRPAP